MHIPLLFRFNSLKQNVFVDCLLEVEIVKGLSFFIFVNLRQ